MPRAQSAGKPRFTPSPNELVERFSQAIQSFPEAETRKMFGYPAAFVNGRMFAGLFADSMMLRLSEPDRAAMGKKGAKPFEPMPGRPMQEYVTVPEEILHSPRQLNAWLAKAFAYTQSLPPRRGRSGTRRANPA